MQPCLPDVNIMHEVGVAGHISRCSSMVFINVYRCPLHYILPVNSKCCSSEFVFLSFHANHTLLATFPLLQEAAMYSLCYKFTDDFGQEDTSKS